MSGFFIKKVKIFYHPQTLCKCGEHNTRAAGAYYFLSKLTCSQHQLLMRCLGSLQSLLANISSVGLLIEQDGTNISTFVECLCDTENFVLIVTILCLE